MTNVDIFDALRELGFTHFFQVEHTVDLIQKEMAKQMGDSDEKPSISPFCPAIIRLIQIRFPSLVNNLLQVKSPIMATALYCRKSLENEGLDPAETGLFYVTPCAAKIAAIKSDEETSSIITGDCMELAAVMAGASFSTGVTATVWV